MSAASTPHVYGPVPSRRLGRSLGVDLVPFKTCTYDCIYCQLGRTTDKTIERKEYVPIDAVFGQLAEKLARQPPPDFIGLAGSGEPTLHARIGELIGGIKKMSRVPVAVLTNGSLLWMPEVREELALADLVLPSLDAGDAQEFEDVNRPHQDIPFDRMLEGLIAFAEGFRGALWLEVFVLPGITDSPGPIHKIASLVKRIRPARVQLNTVSRPPAENRARAASAERLAQLAGMFPGAVDVIGGGPRPAPAADRRNRHTATDIQALVARRPCTIEDIAAGLNLAPNEVLKYLAALCASGAVRTRRLGDTVFYERGQKS